ncbi:MAG: MazG nucleotide pyrophosphohydrolase domain-containing protein [Candidatus Moraniibacteriota bacterium]
MTFEQFRQFIDEQHAFFRKVKKQTRKDRIFARTIKLGEEYGELCDAVLASMGDQRRGKLKKEKPDDLESEFADVLIVTFMLAKAMDVDIMTALDRKIEKIRKRNKE